MKAGENEMTFTVPAGDVTTGVVWDYVRLELNDGSKAYPTPPDNQRPDDRNSSGGACTADWEYSCTAGPDASGSAVSGTAVSRGATHHRFAPAHDHRRKAGDVGDRPYCAAARHRRNQPRRRTARARAWRPGRMGRPRAGNAHHAVSPVPRAWPNLGPRLAPPGGREEAYETRWAYNKYHKGGLVVRAPNADLSRDPRWGRSEESYGEDPYLVGTLASAFSEGLQGNNPKTWMTGITAEALSGKQQRGWPRRLQLRL